MKYKIQGVDNAIIVVAPSYSYESLLELKSLKLFFKRLNDLLKGEVDVFFYAFWGKINEEEYLLREMLNTRREKNVLFWIGDEEGYIPSDEIFQRFSFIFKVHLNNQGALKVVDGINLYKKGLYHFPLLTIDNVPELPVISFDKRKYDLYYCGNLNKNRLPLYLSLNPSPKFYEYIINFLLRYKLKGGNRLFEYVYEGKTFDFSNHYKKSYLQFYSGFNKGDSYDIYAYLLQNSKVVLSPCGFYSTECFRFYEAMRQGCIVITEQLPHVFCYKDAPCIIIDSWKNLPKILADKKLLDSFDPNQIRKYYDERLSISGIANYVYSILISRKE